MKRILWTVLLALALPMAAFASSSVDFTNSGGTLSGSSAGLSLSGSVLIAVNGLNGMGLVTGSDLGSVSFHDRGFEFWESPDGWDVCRRRIVHDYGERHEWHSERDHIQRKLLWSGDLDSGHPGQWNPQLHADGFDFRDMDGRSWVNGATVQLTINTGKGFFNGSTTICERRHEYCGSRAGHPDASGHGTGWPCRSNASARSKHRASRLTIS